jgi:hypothetical protein
MIGWRLMRPLVSSLIVLVAMCSVALASTGQREHHLRLRTKHGPVHVWFPAGYDRATAATVVFVHGYFADVDTAWSRYRLAAQFRASRMNALFVACEAPTSPSDRVTWASLGDLLRAVGGKLGALPEGRLVVIGHSGAHRTLAGWLDDPRIDTIALVDAAYSDLSVYRAWLEQRSGRRLIDVGDVTRAVTDAFHDDLPETLVVDRFPPPERGVLSPEVQCARVVYVRSFIGHMELVTGGVALPMILRALEAPLVEDIARDTPIPQLAAGDRWASS